MPQLTLRPYSPLDGIRSPHILVWAGLAAAAGGATIWFLPSAFRVLSWTAVAVACFLALPLLWREGYTWVILWLAPVAALDPFPAPAVRAAKYALVVLAVSIALAKRHLEPRAPGTYVRVPLWIALALLAWVWIRALTGNQPLAGAGEAARLSAVAGLAYLWLSEPLRAGGRRRWYVLWMLMGIYQFIACGVEAAVFGQIRSYGTLSNANAMGTYLMLTLAIAAAAALWAPTLRARLGSRVLVFLLLAALYLTGSRAAWLGTAVTFLILVLVARRWRLLALGASLLAALGMLYATNPVVRFTVDATLRLRGGLTHRPLLWTAADRAWSRALFVGHGLEAAGEEMQREVRYPSPAHRAVAANIVRVGNPHNFYREFLVETGLIGLALLLSLVASLLAVAWRTRTSGDRWRSLYALALFCVTPGVLVHSCFERSVLLGSMSAAVFYWFLVAQTLRSDDVPAAPAHA